MPIVSNTIDESFPPTCWWFHTVDEAIGKMLEAIKGAQFSVKLEIYIFQDCPVGELFRTALIEACRRGVVVQVMVDSLGSYNLPETYFKLFQQAGGEFRWFNPIRLQRIGFRDHRKILVVDDVLAIVGGFNIATEYCGDGLNRGWHDTSVLLPKELAVELGHIFDEMFQLPSNKPRPWLNKRNKSNQKVVSTDQGDIITSGPSWRGFRMQKALVHAIQHAKRIQLISAYFLPPRQIRRALAKVARNGVSVTIILAAKTDVALAQSAARRLYTGLLRAGIRIFEYQPQVLHSKLYIFDDHFFVGSANMDKRSLHINYELLIRLRQQPLLLQAQRFFDKALSHSEQITLEKWRKSHTFLNWLHENWAWFLLAQVDPYLAHRQFALLRGEVLGEVSKKQSS